MTLLPKHGLHASELVSLTADAFDFEEQTLTFWLKKTKEWTTHELTVAAYKTAVSYHPSCPPNLGSRKGGELGEIWFNHKGEPRERKIGTLSAHDCRHYCATDMAKRGYTIKKLMD